MQSLIAAAEAVHPKPIATADFDRFWYRYW